MISTWPVCKLNLVTTVRVHAPDLKRTAAIRDEDDVTTVGCNRRIEIFSITGQLLLVRSVQLHYPEVPISGSVRGVNDPVVRSPAKTANGVCYAFELRLRFISWANPDIGCESHLCGDGLISVCCCTDVDKTAEPVCELANFPIRICNLPDGFSLTWCFFSDDNQCPFI